MSGAKRTPQERLQKRIALEYSRGAAPKELAKKHNIHINTVYAMLRHENQKVERPAKKKNGAPYGNTNAVGNNGGAPLGSKNAQKHGAYSSIFMRTMTEEEQAIFNGVETGNREMLLEEIGLLSVREYRLMKTINEFRSPQEGNWRQSVSRVVRSEVKRQFSSEEEQREYEERVKERVDQKEELPGHAYHIQTSTEANYNIVLRLEAELSRCQGQKSRCIQTLAEIETDDVSNGTKDVIKAWVDAVMEASGDEE